MAKKFMVKKVPKDSVHNDFYRILMIIKNRENKRFPIYFQIPKFSQLNGKICRIKSLAKVEKNLLRGKYTNRPWKFIKDANQAFEFIKDNHSNKTKTYKTACEEMFSSQMDILMEEIGYCCGHWYTQSQRPVYCSGISLCIVKTDLYYRFEEWTYCQDCFNQQKELMEPKPEQFIHKSQFLQHALIRPQPERFVKCKICFRSFHEVCVLHLALSREDFHCKQCHELYGLKKIPVRASKLPSTECDCFIADYLRAHLVDEQQVLTIRLLSNVEHPLKVKRLFEDFRGGADEFTYKNCTLFVFFDTGQDTDICFFSLFFQLYGNECAEPNRNTAYISYIDSINLCPSNNRTMIYRLVLIGLFAYLKTKGFDKILMWSCPSEQNQDYIFYMKPPKMKMPTKERLSNWYKDLFKLAVNLNVIHSYCGVNGLAKMEGWDNVNHVPYLDGDMWVTRMEEAVETVKKDALKLKDEVIKMRLRDKNHPTSTPRDQLRLKDLKKRLSIKEQEVLVTDKNAKLWELLKIQISGFNSQYFAIKLWPTKAPENQDQNIPIINKWPWINDRHLFVDFFWGNMLEFSSDRRAQFSTFVMLHRLFAEAKICVRCGLEADKISSALLCFQCHVTENQIK